MVFIEDTIKYGIEDPLNNKRYRNIRNTNKDAYNCGGYALGTFSWYCPHAEDNNPFGFINFMFSGLTVKEIMEEATFVSVEQMLIDFPDLRVISTLAEVCDDEYAIAFRVSSDGDFHYVKRAKNGKWYHKRGSYYRIEVMTEEEVFSDSWCYRYDGRIVLFAKKF